MAITARNTLGLVAVLAGAALLLMASTANAGTFQVQTATTSAPYTAFGSVNGSLSTGQALLNDVDNEHDITCTTFTITGFSLVTPGTPPVQPNGFVHGGVTFAGCKESLFGAACTVTAGSFNWSTSVETDPTTGMGGHTPKLVIKGPSIRVQCMSGLIDCTFTTATLEASLHNGPPLSISWSDGTSPSLNNTMVENKKCGWVGAGTFEALITVTGVDDKGGSVPLKWVSLL